MSVPEYREVEITKAVEVDIDVDSLVEAVGELTEAVAALTTQVEKSIEELRSAIVHWTP